MSGDAEADWLSRSTAAGVVWAHDFRTATEVDRFRWISGYRGGNSPEGAGPNASALRQITTDGIGSNQWCMELLGGVGDGVSWWRPFSPQAGDRGASNLDVRRRPVRLFPNPTEGGDQTATWHFGNYATNKSPSYDNEGETKDGHDFWIQWRLKVDPKRRTIRTATGSGKSIYITRTEASLTPQEINVQINDGSDYPIEMYTGGSPSLQGSSNGPTQNGYLRGEFTNWGRYGGPNWITPYGVWDTFMIHVVPGHENDDWNSNSFADNEIFMWAAHQGDAHWSQIWKRSNYRMDFRDSLCNTNGWNALIASVYTGGTASANWYHRYAQIIFSKQEIALPTV
jgi:hypothetical protein